MLYKTQLRHAQGNNKMIIIFVLVPILVIKYYQTECKLPHLPANVITNARLSLKPTKLFELRMRRVKVKHVLLTY